MDNKKRRKPKLPAWFTAALATIALNLVSAVLYDLIKWLSQR